MRAQHLYTYYLENVSKVRVHKINVIENIYIMKSSKTTSIQMYNENYTYKNVILIYMIVPAIFPMEQGIGL